MKHIFISIMLSLISSGFIAAAGALPPSVEGAATSAESTFLKKVRTDEEIAQSDKANQLISNFLVWKLTNNEVDAFQPKFIQRGHELLWPGLNSYIRHLYERISIYENRSIQPEGRLKPEDLLVLKNGARLFVKLNKAGYIPKDIFPEIFTKVEAFAK